MVISPDITPEQFELAACELVHDRRLDGEGVIAVLREEHSPTLDRLDSRHFAITSQMLRVTTLINECGTDAGERRFVKCLSNASGLTLAQTTVAVFNHSSLKVRTSALRSLTISGHNVADLGRVLELYEQPVHEDFYLAVDQHLEMFLAEPNRSRLISEATGSSNSRLRLGVLLALAKHQVPSRDEALSLMRNELERKSVPYHTWRTLADFVDRPSSERVLLGAEIVNVVDVEKILGMARSERPPSSDAIDGIRTALTEFNFCAEIWDEIKRFARARTPTELAISKELAATVGALELIPLARDRSTNKYHMVCDIQKAIRESNLPETVWTRYVEKVRREWCPYQDLRVDLANSLDNVSIEDLGENRSDELKRCERWIDDLSRYTDGRTLLFDKMRKAGANPSFVGLACYSLTALDYTKRYSNGEFRPFRLSEKEGFEITRAVIDGLGLKDQQHQQPHYYGLENLLLAALDAVPNLELSAGTRREFARLIADVIHPSNRSWALIQFWRSVEPYKETANRKAREAIGRIDQEPIGSLNLVSQATFEYILKTHLWEQELISAGIPEDIAKAEAIS